MPVCLSNRWRLEILSPVDMSILWKAEAPTTKHLVMKWNEETGNDYLDEAKVRRISLGLSKNKHIRLYKIGHFGSRHLEYYPFEDERDSD